MGGLFKPFVFLDQFLGPDNLIHESHLAGAAAGHTMGLGKSADKL